MTNDLLSENVGRESPADHVPALLAVLGGQCPPYIE
jgi:hypothetical protein